MTINPEIETSWQAIETLTATMQSAADSEHWAEVLELATNRHLTIVKHFEQFPVGPQNAEFYRAHLSIVLSGEQELQNLVRYARKALMSAGHLISQGHRAVGAYLESARR